MADEHSELTFEEALKNLEDSVALLKAGDSPLEESIKVYEKCVMYHKICVDILEAAKQKIEIYNPQSGSTEDFGE